MLQFKKPVASRTMKKAWLAACLALVALAATRARADETSRPADDGTARPIPGVCRCGDFCTCFNCGCCDPCQPRPWPKPVPLPGPSGPCPAPWPQPVLPKPWPWLNPPLVGVGH